MAARERMRYPGGYNTTPVSVDQFPPHDPPMSQPGLQPVPPKVGESALAVQQAAAIAANASAQTVRDERESTDRGYSQLEKIFDQAELLLPHATGSGLGKFIDMGTDFIGMSTSSSKAADALEGLETNALRYVPRFKGPDSDRDVANYKKAIGVLGDRGKPVENRLNALKELRKLIAKAKSQGAEVGEEDKPVAPAPDRKSQFKVIR